MKRMESIQCNLCRKKKLSNNFLKNGKTLKSCLECRDKKKTVKEPVALPKKPVPESKTVPKEPVPKEPVPKEPESKELIYEVPIKGWKFLSGKWIKINTELELHQELTKKMIGQFKKRSALPVHQYLMKNVFVDIRDLYIS